ncbi:MAG: O-antigen ligase family protein, partial [Candidatus Sulfotelmatobacter sp.]
SRLAQIYAVLLYGTFGLLMFGPVAFGAVEPWSIFVVETGSVVLASLWLAKQWINGEIDILWNPLYLPMSAFGLLILLQLVLGQTAYRHDSISGAMLYCAYGLLCFLTTQSMVRASQARKIAVVLTVYGVVLAGLALIQGIAPNGKLLWIREPRLGGWIYGSYVNHNHYAGLMELLVPIPLVLALSHMLHEKERTVAGVAAAIMVGTIFLSGSRGGMIAIFVELAVIAVVLLRQKKATYRIALGAAAFAIVLVSMLVWLGGKQLSGRVSSISKEARTEISGGMRLSIDRDTIHMFRRKPVLGWGLGTFPVVYPEFRTFYTNFFVNEAHNDYLQLLAETGVLGFGLMIWFLIVLYRRAFRKIGNWTTDVSSAVTLACTLGFTGILVHSLVDFNLQIPANAAIFYVFCSIAAGPALLQRSRKRKPAATEEEFFPASEVV